MKKKLFNIIFNILANLVPILIYNFKFFCPTISIQNPSPVYTHLHKFDISMRTQSPPSLEWTCSVRAKQLLPSRLTLRHTQKKSRLIVQRKTKEYKFSAIFSTAASVKRCFKEPTGACNPPSVSYLFNLFIYEVVFKSEMETKRTTKWQSSRGANLEELCRICGCKNRRFIALFRSDGTACDITDKICCYLGISVSRFCGGQFGQREYYLNRIYESELFFFF